MTLDRRAFIKALAAGIVGASLARFLWRTPAPVTERHLLDDPAVSWAVKGPPGWRITSRIWAPDRTVISVLLIEKVPPGVLPRYRIVDRPVTALPLPHP